MKPFEEYPEVKELMRKCLHCKKDIMYRTLCSGCYRKIHDWAKIYTLKRFTCQICCEFKKTELANISQEYKRDVADFEWICRKCHRQKYKLPTHINLLRAKIINFEKEKVEYRETGCLPNNKWVKWYIKYNRETKWK